jgi:cytochrome c oxidase subunit 2
MRSTTVRRFLIPTVAATLVLVACGSDSGGPELEGAAAAGRDLTRSNGCASCHGANGQGGVGPAFEDLFGSEVTLDDGTTVIADEDYLRESITDPRAKVVDGYGLPMPTNNLSAEEIDEIIAYIVALSAEAAETPVEG